MRKEHRTPTLLRSPLTLGIMAICASASSLVHAAWDIYPEATVEAAVDDNVRLSQAKDDGEVYAAEGRLIVRNLQETTVFDAELAARRTEYSGVDLDGQTSASARMAAEKATERAKYGLIGVYTNYPMLRNGLIDLDTGDFIGRADIPDADAGAGEDPDDNPDLDTGTVEAQVRRQQFRIAPYVQYKLTQRSNLRLMANYSELLFNNEAEILGFRDSKNFGGGLQYQYRVTERDMVRTTFRLSHIEPDTPIEFDRYDLTVGWSRNVTENTRFQVEGGVSRAKSDTGNEKDGAIFGASVNSKLQRGQITAGIERRNYPTGFGDLVETDRALASWEHYLSERWQLLVTGNYSSTQSEVDQLTDQDRDLLDVETRVSYFFTPNWQVGTGYRYRWVDRERNESSANSNTVLVFLSYSPQRPF